MTSTERLYEYISARTYGEHHVRDAGRPGLVMEPELMSFFLFQGNCATAYPQCPFSVFSFLDPEEAEVLLNAIP